ncbi:MAG: outer membrane protein assembly factor [Dokdonella sp.]|uniref:autotransporter assembly complex protein TamA n=1 Tax=Dokdonella sp. TaxID=2291710 RepID=UPI0025BBEEA6|nr:autotransporter assembly complex family protein [Dokdonella sp.]MBZ0223139.1 autotransporter assembly complex protein TamA [Dokdonella sp.]MCC7256191.1 outer membrane protein assembly factor [Dokdonella sp.]
MRRWSARTLCLLLVLAAHAQAARVATRIDGIDDSLLEAVKGALEINQYQQRDVTDAQLRRLLERAPAQAQKALEPYGYFDGRIESETRDEAGQTLVLLHVTPGPVTQVTNLDIKLDGDAEGQHEVRKALAAFTPAKGQALDQAAYEKSKAIVQAALAASGYLDAELVTHQIEVTRATHSAQIHLAWKVGARHRFGTTTFSGSQFPDALLERYIPWREGDFYTQERLLALQQRLIDADYFAYAQVQPDLDHVQDEVVPISVTLAPAKRTIYTGGVFIGTDTGPGVRGGIQRRWLNSRGHKLALNVLAATQLKTATMQYQIPLAGADNHSIGFGANFRNEDTDAATSRTFGLVASDSRLWHGWTRTASAKFLTGNFRIANLQGDTTLLYPEISLTRKRADEPMFVRDGWSLSMSARGAARGLLSDANLLQTNADAKWIHALGERSRFIARGALGATWTTDFDKLPPELRFFAGGDRSIRGYAYQTIGTPLPPAFVPFAQAECAAHPKRNCQDLIIGGKFLAVASAEYEYYFKPNWGIAGFVDSGDAFSTFDDYEQKIGIGIGARWRSPVGLIRVDLGVPIADRDHHGVQLHIVIGPDL